ncbi:MAG: hypothetical protein OHK93_005378 [Ramalina farinacea]|uniref:Uncharacterized protein n=1 Tax=Ramalina farinacea TaxID=258253 RepID=A0AA43QWA5_9LECA|nr:hypothetical protein [Ramalina farinacea]
MSTGIRFLIYLSLVITLGDTAPTSNSTGSIADLQPSVGGPPRPFGIPDDFVVQTEDAGHHVASVKTLLFNTITSVQAVCLFGYTNHVARFRLRDPSLPAGDVLDFQITEPQEEAVTFEARYVLWGLYLCALEFRRLPDGDVPLGQGIYYCDFQMPGLGTGQFTYEEESLLLNGTSSQPAETSVATSKNKRQRGLAPVLGPASNETTVTDPSSASVTSVGPQIRIYNRGSPVPPLTVCNAFAQVMIARASIPYPAPIPSYSYNLVGLGPFNIEYRASQTPGAPPADVGTVIPGLAEVPKAMLAHDRFTECDFDIIQGNKLVVSGSFRRISGSTSLPAVQVT